MAEKTVKTTPKRKVKAKTKAKKRKRILKKGQITKPEKFTIEQVEQALRRSAGLHSIAAKKLKCTRQTVDNYVSRYPYLREVEADILEANLDMTEATLLTAIKKGNMQGTMFFLKTKGKKRGYTQGVEHFVPPGPDGAQGAGVLLVSAPLTAEQWIERQALYEKQEAEEKGKAKSP